MGLRLISAAPRLARSGEAGERRWNDQEIELAGKIVWRSRSAVEHARRAVCGTDCHTRTFASRWIFSARVFQIVAFCLQRRGCSKKDDWNRVKLGTSTCGRPSSRIPMRTKKRLTPLALLPLVLTLPTLAWAQSPANLPVPPTGFDQSQNGVPQGMVTTITYATQDHGP